MSQFGTLGLQFPFGNSQQPSEDMANTPDPAEQGRLKAAAPAPTYNPATGQVEDQGAAKGSGPSGYRGLGAAKGGPADGSAGGVHNLPPVNNPFMTPRGQMPVPQIQPRPLVPPPGQPLPEPFTQADTIRLQKLQQALSMATKQVDDGVLFPHEGQALRQNILQQLAPLQSRQQKDEQQKKDKLKGDMMDQLALQHTVDRVHAKSLADTFHEGVATHFNPITGAVEHFYQDGKGNFKPIEYLAHKAQMEQQAASLGGGVGA